jgi:hypothetical protein
LSASCGVSWSGLEEAQTELWVTAGEPDPDQQTIFLFPFISISTLRFEMISLIHTLGRYSRISRFSGMDA